MVYKPKRTIRLGRDCADFKRCTRENPISVPLVVKHEDSVFKGTPFDSSGEIDWDGTPFGHPEPRRKTKPAPTPAHKVVVIDCARSEECGDRVHFGIPSAVRGAAGVPGLGDCIGVRFEKDDVSLLKEGLATLEDE